MQFAKVADLEARWRPLSDDERDTADVLLSDASAMLASMVDIPEHDDGFPELLSIVACSMVQRAMSSAASDTFGVTQQSMTAGPYTQSWSYSNPTGDMYLTKMEKDMLGISRGYIGSIRPMVGRREHDRWR